jgi:hypothetical protein
MAVRHISLLERRWPYRGGSEVPETLNKDKRLDGVTSPKEGQTAHVRSRYQMLVLAGTERLDYEDWEAMMERHDSRTGRRDA